MRGKTFWDGGLVANIKKKIYIYGICVDVNICIIYIDIIGVGGNWGILQISEVNICGLNFQIGTMKNTENYF